MADSPSDGTTTFAANLDPYTRHRNKDPPGKYRSQPPSRLVELAVKNENQPIYSDVALRISELWNSSRDQTLDNGKLKDTPETTAGMFGTVPEETLIMNSEAPRYDIASEPSHDDNVNHIFQNSIGEISLYEMLTQVPASRQREPSGPLIDSDSGAVDVDELGASAGLDVDSWATILHSNTGLAKAASTLQDVAVFSNQNAEPCHDVDNTKISTKANIIRPDHGGTAKVVLARGVSITGSGATTILFEA